MEKLQGFTDHVMLYVKTLVKWLLAAALIGTVGGAVGSLFHLGVEYATELRTEVPALLYALPLAGVLIVALYRFLRTQGVGTNAVLDAVHQGRELPILLIPCITSSLVAYAVSLRFGIEPMRFAVAAPETGALTLARAAVLALGCALVSILFCEMLHRTEHLTERLVKNDYLRAFLGGCLVIALTLLAGCRDYNGAGGHVIAAALGGTAKPEAFLLKIVFTAVTLGCGFKGGEIVPTLFVGSTFGCAAGALLGLPAGFAAALGITGLFCGMTSCPLTSLLISVELFGADGLLCYAVVCAVSYVCSGYRGLYSSQTILYSKLRAEFINVHTK